MNKTTRRLAAIGVGVLAAASVGAGVATADPSGAPTPRALTGVGSDTVQDVENGMSNTVTFGGQKVLGSWNATGSATFNTGKAGCGAVSRPNGSGAGRTALLNSLNAGDGCIQYSRSSSDGSGTAASPKLDYVPFATDGVTYAVNANSSIPRDGLTLTDLQAIYHCDPAYDGGDGVHQSSYDITPILPQSGSGTRSFWEGQMNISDTDVNNGVYPCIYNGVKNGVTIEEHTGTALDAKSIEPFSVPQYISQLTGVITDRRSQAVLGTIGNVGPLSLNGSFPVQRPVFNVIPDSQKATDPYKSVFVGSGSSVCADGADRTRYGFAAASNCGTLFPTP